MSNGFKYGHSYCKIVLNSYSTMFGVFFSISKGLVKLELSQIMKYYIGLHFN